MSELDERVTKLEADLSGKTHLFEIKNEELKALREASLALAQQHRSKWTLVNSFTLLLAFLFTINFGYQVYKTTKVVALAAKLDLAVKHNEQMQQESAALVATTSDVMKLLATGYNFHSRGRYRGSRVNADEALIVIQNQACSIRKESPLYASIETLTAASLMLKARASWSIGDYETLFEIGNAFHELDPKDWNGYHCRGLYYLEYKFDRDSAAKEFQESLRLRPKYNPDHFNLIEVSLTMEDYERVISTGKIYLEGYPEHAEAVRNEKLLIHLSSIADMYVRIAQLMTNKAGAAQKLRNYLEIFKSADLDLRRQFGSNAIRDFVSRLSDSSKHKGLEGSAKKLIGEATAAVIRTAP